MKYPHAMKYPLIALLLTAAPLDAGGLDPASIPASARWVLHLDLEAMRASETGKEVLTGIEEEHGVRLQALKRISSFHLLDDPADITLFGDGQPDHAVALIRGKFNQPHLVDVVKAADEYSGEDHQGTIVHAWKDQKGLQQAAFAANDLLVFSRQGDALLEELDLLEAGRGATVDQALTQESGGCLLFAAANLAEIPLPKDSSRLLRLTTMLRISAREEGGRLALRMDAGCRDETQANRMRRMLDGILALAEIANPVLGGADFKGGVALAGNKTGVKVKLSVPVADGLRILQQAAERKTRKSD